MQSLLQLNTQSKILIARLSVLHSRIKSRSDAQVALRVMKNSKFKIIQISNVHMITDVKVCKDAINAHGNHLPESEADLLTINFIGKILNIEKSDLVILTEDQLHHNIFNSQSALFKMIAPIIKCLISFAVIFDNHNSEGIYALSHK